MSKPVTTSIGTYRNTEPVRMNELVTGDTFVHWAGSPDYGPTGNAVYQVTTDCATSNGGQLHVHELTLTDKQHRANGVEPGGTLRGGTFGYGINGGTWPTVQRILDKA